MVPINLGKMTKNIFTLNSGSLKQNQLVGTLKGTLPLLTNFYHNKFKNFSEICTMKIFFSMH